MSSSFHPLRVVDVSAETADALTLTLAPANGDGDGSDFAFTAGQHLTLRADIAGEDVRRNYSLFMPPSERSLRVAIKRVAGGRFSEWVAHGLKPGDTIEAMTPRGHFTWDFESGNRRNYVAFAGGSGITPILSLIATGLESEHDSQFTLLYGNRSADSIMFLETLAALKDRYLSRFQLYHFLTAESDDVELFNGRLDAERIATLLESLIDPAQVDVAFICGPGAMMDTAECALVEAGVDPDRVLVERFSTGPQDTRAQAVQRETARKAEGLRVGVTLEGRRRQVAFDAERGNILDSARAAGMPAPYACKAGVCATCRAKLLKGKVSMAANYGLSKEEVAAGYILTCQAVPETDDVMVDYDA